MYSKMLRTLFTLTRKIVGTHCITVTVRLRCIMHGNILSLEKEKEIMEKVLNSA